MKRFLTLVMILTMILQCAFMAACNGNELPENTLPDSTVYENAETSNEETQKSDQPALIFDSSAVYYTIIRGTYADSIEVGAAVDLNNAIKSCYSGEGKTSIKDDFFIGQVKGEIYDIEGCEILVGLTNRRESQDVYSSLPENGYAIKKIGDKIVIVGTDSYATAQAVEVFIAEFLSSPVDKLELDTTLEISGEANLRKISINENATYRIMTWNLGCMVSEDKNGEIECAEILLKYLPDILGLQECNAAVHNKVLNSLPDYYKFANKKHTGKSTVNYTPIIYNSNLFTLVKSDLVWLRGRYTGTNTKSLNWAVLEDKNGDRFAVINFHGAVCSNSYSGFENYTSSQLSAQAHEWKLDNVAQVLEIKDAITAEFGNIPIMITGDNNFNSSSEQYAILTSKGFTDAEHTARISRMTGYKTSYGYGSVPGEGLSIDHIFGLNGVDFVTHTIVRDTDVWKASDHCPVYVDFNISKE